MAKCINCNKTIPTKSVYCNYCGQKQGASKKKNKYYVRPDGLHETIKTINGKRVAFRGRTDAEVDRKILEYRGEVARGRYFKDIAADWKEIHYPTISYTTQRGYNAAYTRAVEEIGDKPILQITAADIKQHLDRLSGKRLSQKTIRTQLLIYSLVFAYAAERGEVDVNVAQNVTMPKYMKPPAKRESASEEDERRIKENIDIWLLPYFLLYTGMRRGEALAIQFKDIDLNEKTIAVTKSVYFKNNRPNIKIPKTLSGVRNVPLLEPLAAILPSGNPDDYLFSLDGGKTPMPESSFHKQWNRYSAKTGISCTAHQLRHSFASMLFEAEIDVKDAQKILGHSTESVTRDVYTHIRDTRRKETTNKLNQHIRNLGKTKEDTANTQ